MEKDRIILCVCETNDDTSGTTDLAELTELVKTAGGEVVAELTQKRDKPDPACVFGEGKIAELKELCEKLEATLIVYNGELSPMKLRNIEKATDVRVIDRTMLILDIFAGNAVTAEGKLQVELAQAEYTLPRLTGKGIQLSRQGGTSHSGIGARGPGETRLETDKRHIRRRITKLKEELRELAGRREQYRTRRSKDGRVTAAVVGYTNAGKSTLINSLTGADLYAEDKLFATLDITTRELALPGYVGDTDSDAVSGTVSGASSILITDTVGFIRNLPHKLVEAFKSTLEEAASADVLIHVYDGSDTEAAEKIAATTAVLQELNCAAIPTVLVCNKCDKLTNYCGGVRVAAVNGDNLHNLLAAIAAALPKTHKRVTFTLPFGEAGIIAKIRERGRVITEEYTESGLTVTAEVNIADMHLIRQ